MRRKDEGGGGEKIYEKEEEKGYMYGMMALGDWLAGYLHIMIRVSNIGQYQMDPLVPIQLLLASHLYLPSASGNCPHLVW